MQIAISVYQQLSGKTYSLTPMVPGLFDWSSASGDLGKARQRLIERVRKEVPNLPLEHVARLSVPTGRQLRREHLELVLREEGEKQRVTGFFPVVLDLRPCGADRIMSVAYHPLRPSDWVETNDQETLRALLARHYSRTFDPDENWDLLRSSGTEKLVTLRFQVDAPNLRKLLKSNKTEEFTGPGRSGELAQLLRVAVNQTARAATATLPLGLPRERERRRLQQLLCGDTKTPVLVVGAPGSGKSTLIAQSVYDLLEADDFPAHRNLDRVHNVLAFGGRQIIAGMSYVGQWEARCVELLARAKKRRQILWIDDVHAFPSIGKTTESERTLADFFAGPLARRDLVMIAECTPEQLSVLQHESPAFAAAFSVVRLDAATTAETLSMLLFESRQLEQVHGVAIEPRALPAILMQSSALLGGTALPGRALGPLRAIAKRAVGKAKGSADTEIGVDAVLEFFSEQTGLPELLLSSNSSLERAPLERELSRQIVGQRVAVDAACDLILSLRARLCAAGRPYAVFLFTGPTGTGKTELAKCLAEYLYSTPERLLRFDMGEFGTADAVARLIGDQFVPEGLLTSRVRAQPFSVLLFDEVEKAHPSVLNLMLQIFEDARLSDARGSVTDFSHAVIVLTSNLGTGRAKVRGFAEAAEALELDIARAVREFFPPELFNRIDRVVPFAALDSSSAHQIVKKELSLLAARPGLSERNTFVRFTDAVVRRVAEEGYSAEYGARSLKRYIDREVGEALTRCIVGDAPAEMRLLWLYAAEGATGVSVRSEALREAEPYGQASKLLPLLESNYSQLCARIPLAVAKLERFETDGRLGALGQQLSTELRRYRLGERGRATEVYNLDSLREHAQKLSLRMEARLRSDEGLEARERHLKLSRGQSLTAQDFTTVGGELEGRFEPELTKPFAPVDLRGTSERTRALLQDLVECELLEGLLESAHEPDRHAVLIEVLKLSSHHERRRFSKGGPGLAEWLVEGYANARGELDSVAIGEFDGSVRVVTKADLDDALERRPQIVALRLVGPGIANFLGHENGCQVRRTLASGPEIVRVRVVPGHHEPLAWVERHRAELVAFERALEGEGVLGRNPEALMPVLRSLRFDPDSEQPAPLRVEDYRLSYVTERRVRDFREMLTELLILEAGVARPPATEEENS